MIAGGYNWTDRPPFRVFQSAEQRVPFVFNSPHSGRDYPDCLRAASTLGDLQLRYSEDVAVDRLFAPVVELGAPLLAASFPRAWLDVNREPLELDPRLFVERLPAGSNTKSVRVGAGLGTIPRLISENMSIYREPPKLDEALARLHDIYKPYHETLTALLVRTCEAFGHAVLVDCHSMPSRSPRGGKSNRADIIIGDRFGCSCNDAIAAELVTRFAECGYSVARNKPYAGGFITEHYGNPQAGLHAVQIEINRALYMNETTLTLTTGFDRLRDDIEAIMARLVSLPDSSFGAEPLVPLAAE